MGRIGKLTASLEEKQGYYISSFANIFYYSGFTSEDARLLITKNESILFTDSRYTVQAKKQAKDFEIRDIKYIGNLEDYGIEKLGFEEDYLTVKELAKINAGDIKVFPAGEIISKPRQTKDEFEIAKIAEAERLGDEAFSYILDFLKPGKTEKEIALELEFFLRRKGAEKLSFDTIAASGERSCMPHGVAGDKVIEKGEFLTLDFGCVLDGYCSDMTRTVAIGTPSDEMKNIYDIVLKAQTSALETIGKGKACKDIDFVARKVIEDAGFGKNFGHSLGHSVGIEIHENPNLSPKSADILEVGNVVSVEPGIYLDGFFGVRIEDLVVIGEKNTVNLTKSKKELIII